MADSITDIVSNINPMESLSKKDRQDLALKIDVFLTALIAFLIVVFPFVVAPFMTDGFDFPKQTIALIGGAIGVFLWLVATILGKKPTIVRSPLDWPLLFLIAVSLLSAFIVPNRTVAVFSDPMLIFGSALLFFLIVNVVSREKLLSMVAKILLATGAILGIIAIVQTIYSLAGPALKLPANIFYLAPTFSLTGSLLTQSMFLVALIPFGVGVYFWSKEKGGKWLSAILVGAIVIGAVVSLFNIYSNRPILLPVDSGWKIATGVMGQSLQSAILGVGPANFVDAFTAYKPIQFNNTPYWNLRFTTSSNYYFYILSTFGIAGLAAIVFLVWRFFSMAKKRLEADVASNLEKGLIVSVSLILGGLIFLPGPGLVIYLLFILLGLLVANYRVNEVRLYAREDEQFFEGFGKRVAVLAIMVIVLLGGGYFLGRTALADYYFASSLSAAAANRGADTYNLQIKAIQANPDNDSYHVSYSLTNLALANSLAGQPNLSDQQKQTVVQLVQQAIREARVAVALAPARSGDYENLSLVYRNLINFAQGADQWAIASQQQAVTFDPTNPRLRLDLGGIYLALGDYQSAGQNFAQAVNLKPDYANAHYNLAQAMKLLKLNDQATQQFQATATIVCAVNPESNDCKTVNADIASMATPTPPTTVGASPSGQLQTATPAAQTNALPKAATKPPAKISSPSGEITP